MMKELMLAAAGCAALNGFAGLYGDIPDARHAWAVHDMNRPNPVKVTARPGLPPSDAIVLFDGSKESFEKNWCDGKGQPTKWKLGDEGDFYCVPGWKNGGAIFTRGSYGDCQLHLEYRHDKDIEKSTAGAQMRGNSGVFLMGKYEIQVLESYYTDAKNMKVPNYADGQAGAVYAENPPMVNPARKPGEWQVYDIVFHQPVWEGAKLLHPGSVSVFFNGVLVQDHWEMEGLSTHCRRKPLAPHEKKGPLSFQDHGCVVHFRNIWLRPLPSRWDNTTHSVMSGKEADVMALRRETAAKLFAKIVDPKAPTAENVNALAEVVAYANEGKYAETFRATAGAYKTKLDGLKDDQLKAMKGELESVRKSINVLIRGGVATEKCPLKAKIDALAAKFGWKLK